jgi:hypothetical protein
MMNHHARKSLHGFTVRNRRNLVPVRLAVGRLRTNIAPAKVVLVAAIAMAIPRKMAPSIGTMAPSLLSAAKHATTTRKKIEKAVIPVAAGMTASC